MKNKYVLFGVAFIVLFVWVRFYYIEKGKSICNEQVQIAVQKEKERSAALRIEAQSKAFERLDQLRKDNDEGIRFNEELDFELENDTSNTCFSPSNVLRLNRVR